MYEEVGTQRTRLKVGKLSKVRKARPDKIGFSFELINPWIENYEIVEGCNAQQSGANIPTKPIEVNSSSPLGIDSNGEYRSNELTKIQIQLHEKLQRML